MQFRTLAASCLLMTCLGVSFSGLAAADGLDTLQQRTFAIDLYDYAAGNGAQVAVGSFFYDNSQGNALTSTNGVDWKQVKLSDEMPYSVNTVTYFNGRFIVPGLGAVYTSTDGSSWTKVPETRQLRAERHCRREQPSRRCRNRLLPVRAGNDHEFDRRRDMAPCGERPS